MGGADGVDGVSGVEGAHGTHAGGRGAGRARALLAPLGLAAVAAAAVAYVGVVDPNRPGHYPTCPFLLLTGLYCPGCGTLRALNALAHADPVAALGLNPLAVLTIPFLVFWWGRWLVRAWRGRPVRTRLAPPIYIWSFLGLIIVYWIVRNLPFGAFLAP
ncbi:hypothetical protein Skr01_58640 [Sphaerisporangium krabiense]|uniref:DUF2752 domain-containing protein n=1 Tax=Sphaerisporangium krabiense TaxID=763782 RepID=A0A7W8Z8M8_9ACTN|nr:DUF2752 domain-containing protein [Sphaerisporangium krabiense]MBB5629370.1 hypothetical protein [Sphaerisporangium krabiense]GII65779.1 hypothetical protein Skr01_58640 [Sphaerisporangium krabiense]